jgi:hypothetical protein
MRDDPAAQAAAQQWLEKGLAILYRLRDESRLTPAQMGWITDLEQQLAKPEAEREQRSFFGRLAGGFRRFFPGRS